MGEKHICRILVFKIVSQYNALSVFEEELIQNWKHMGITVDSMKWQGAESMEWAAKADYDLIFSINGGINDGGWDDFCAPVYSYYVDHPLHHEYRLRTSDMQHCISVDADFESYLNRHYHFIHKPEMVMQAGVEGIHSKRPFQERRYPVVFCGSYRDYHMVLDNINSNNKGFRTFLRFMIDEALQSPVLTMEQIYDKALLRFQLPLDEDEYTEFLFACREVEIYLRGYYRAMVVKQLVEAGIPVEIYGDGWENLDCERKDLLHCHPPVDYREMLDVFADTQIVINVMPWAKAGFHDRIACAMLNGALVLSDETTYMREQALDGKQMVLYSLDSLEEVPQKVSYYLERLGEAENVAQSGYVWAKENHTWKNRAEQFLQIFERN